MKIGDRVRNMETGDLGTVIDIPMDGISPAIAVDFDNIGITMINPWWLDRIKEELK
ncbi:hypothetical protein [Listeria goaensis]|uniref:hypothetical protein n=1 Tax=Listeria goaensis TaxID=1649188 RepID=UPI0013C2A505|nr:hypothetical protein [Listeria goaensis]